MMIIKVMVVEILGVTEMFAEHKRGNNGIEQDCMWCAKRKRKKKLTSLIGQMGQQVPASGGKGFVHATEQTISLQTKRLAESHVHEVQTSGCQDEPSGCVLLW